MRKVSLRFAICGLSLLLTTGGAWGQAGPGQAEALCEGLQDATPGLYGLCLAFHNVEPCVPDLLPTDSFGGCEPKDGRLLAEYNALKGPDDPRMPGTEEPSPCFTRTQLEDEAALAEVAACRDIIADLIRSREYDCLFLCDPVCPEE